jgi:hypothetical protein
MNQNEENHLRCCREDVVSNLEKIMMYASRFAAFCQLTPMDNSYDNIDQFARRLFVWRKPVPKFQQSTVRNFLLRMLHACFNATDE